MYHTWKKGKIVFICVLLRVEGEDVLNFALAYDLLIANTVFKKRESHLVTFRSGQHSSQIDFILARRGIDVIA